MRPPAPPSTRVARRLGRMAPLNGQGKGPCRVDTDRNGGRLVAYVGLVIPATAALVGGSIPLLVLASVLPYVMVEAVRPAGERPRAIDRPRSSLVALAGPITVVLVAFELLRAPDIPVTAGVRLCVLVLTALLAWRFFSRCTTPETAERAVENLGACVALVYLAYLLPQLAGGDSRVWVLARDSSMLINPNTLALYLVVAASVALRAIIAGKAVKGSWLRLAILLTAIAATYSRSAYLALVGVLLLGGVRSLRGRVLALTLLASAALWTPVSVRDRIAYTFLDIGFDNSSATRLDLWARAAQLALDHPFSGVGILNLSRHFNAQGMSGTYDYAHNSYLSLVAAFGLAIPGGIALTLLACAWLRRLRRAHDRPHSRLSNSAGGRPAPPSGVVLATTAVIIASMFGEPILSPVVFVPLIALASSRKGTDAVPESPTGMWGNRRRHLVY